MNLIENVFDIAEDFMKDPKHVTIDYVELSKTVRGMKLEKPLEFPKKDTTDIYKTCIMELVGGAINYCYWYGKSTIRPLDSSSTKMYDVVKYAFENFNKTGGIHSFDRCIDSVIKYLSLERFPLLEERIKHLNELRINGQQFTEKICDQKCDLESALIDMVQIFPGYASDMFLKRAFLFFCQMNRNFGWFEKEMNTIPVPSDYQVPKMLHHFWILDYSPELKTLIDSETLIPKGSLMECEIRAATILACRQLVKETGWTVPEVDAYFWLRRKEIFIPFHLTVTSDY